MSYVYNSKFSGNILVVGRTACGKTAFVQRLAVNDFLGDLIKAEWVVSFIKLDKQREAELQSCFDCQLDFYYPRNKEQFDDLLEYFKTKSNSSDPNDTQTCLTIDCTGFNPNGPDRFRTDAANPESQTCFFNKADEDILLNVFVSKKIKKENDPNKLLFEIEGLKSWKIYREMAYQMVEF